MKKTHSLFQRTTKGKRYVINLSELKLNLITQIPFLKNKFKTL